MCVYVYVCVYIYICVCVYMYICVCMYVCVCVYIYICVCICMYVCLFLYIYIFERKFFSSPVCLGQTLQSLFDRIKSQRDEWISDMAEHLQDAEVADQRPKTLDPGVDSPLPMSTESGENHELGW